MISKYNHQKLNWINLENSTTEEIDHVFELYSIPFFIREKINKKQPKAKIDHEGDFLIVYLNFSVTTTENNYLICILNDNYIITIHEQPIKSLVEFKKDLELNLITNIDQEIDNHKILFIYLLKNLFLDLKNKLHIEEIKTKKLEKEATHINRKIFLWKTLFLVSLAIIILLYVTLFI